VKRTLIAAGVVIGIASAAAAAWRVTAGDPAVEITTARVERTPNLQSLVTASGEIVAARYAEIGSNVMGRVVELGVKEGDRVTAGQVLARIDSTQAEAATSAAEAALAALVSEAAAAASQVDGARAALDESRARLTEAAAALTRGRQLRDAGLIAAADFDRLEAAAGTADAQVMAAAAALARAQQSARSSGQRVEQARAERLRARDQLDKTAVTAPISGVVTRLDVELGEMVVLGVQNQPGSILMTISDLSEINAEVKVAEADVMRLSVGLTATVTLEGLPGESFAAKVVEVGASALPQLGNQVAAREFRVKVRLEQPPAVLRPGLTCDADIVAAERRNVLTVPLQAVVEREGRTGVFRVAGDVARFAPVQTGIIGGLSIQVDGVSEGDAIAAGPIQALRTLTEGAAVRVSSGAR
jgi:HlyD family secretion protein